MAITTNPFHPATGELLPGYRDAYLRGDLSGTNTELVDAYLKANPTKGGETFQRFHALQAGGHDVRPVGWLQNQLHLIRTEPARFRQRAGALLAVGILVSGAVFAANTSALHPTVGMPAVIEAPVAAAPVADEAASVLESNSLTTVNGRILDENGRPLIGATIIDKLSGRGVSTDAQGKYTLAVPAHKATQLQFGYGGYTEEMVQVTGRGVQNVTLLPRTDRPKKHHWWQF
ncbi:carboxypeptidase-like regulatory domain-containing protein [Hymenobacter sp. BRD128]|uniref:carboxypeptidase-like regulatory domain-containing protein n=1 Tax=Hymenobacter sp. BRD128 TaxID=2675878 RepID=UPI0015650802|nr:carboxypeptidase-like regulatory domain-containing protein [Hymenobacter sp. BRD128]QKG57301.1 carboxypeptidase-like regulatory domain-containing protein [Hymenobacter sp. BRD128]